MPEGGIIFCAVLSSLESIPSTWLHKTASCKISWDYVTVLFFFTTSFFCLLTYKLLESKDQSSCFVISSQ